MSSILKNIFRWGRGKTHSDLYFRIDALQKAIDDLQINLNSLQTAPVANLREWFNALFINQIMLMNNSSGMRTLLLPWSLNRKTFTVNLNKNKTFTVSPANDSPERRVFITTILKSGTNLLNLILLSLGFKPCGLHALDNRCYDYRFMPSGVYAYANYESNIKEIDLPIPFYALINLIPPGYFLPSHLKDFESIQRARRHGMDKILFTIRDLRHVHVSLMRHVMQRKGFKNTQNKSQEYTSQHMAAYFSEKNNFGKYLFTVINTGAKLAIALKQEENALCVCFEEITSKNKERMERSINSIYLATGKDPDDIFQAIQNSCGSETLTYTGKLSTLDRIWTQEVEDIFIATGGDVLNEQLGYPRHYTPSIS